MASVKVEYVGDVAVVCPKGTFRDESEIEKLRTMLTKLIVEDGHQKTLLNMGGVERIVTRGIAVIVCAHEQAAQRGATFYLCGRPIHPTGLTVMGHLTLNHFEDCDEALKALQEA